MAIQQIVTDPATNAKFPAAYGRIDKVNLALDDSSSVWVTLDWYADVASVLYQPVISETIHLTDSEVNDSNPAFVSALASQVKSGLINSPIDALLAALYILLTQRSAYSSSTKV